MNQKPRRQIRFGVSALFAFVAVCAVVFALMRPELSPSQRASRLPIGIELETVESALGSPQWTENDGPTVYWIYMDGNTPFRMHFEHGRLASVAIGWDAW